MSVINKDKLLADGWRRQMHEMVGFCTYCDHDQDLVSDEIRDEGYTCESCGANAVYGVEQLILMGYGEVSDE